LLGSLFALMNVKGAVVPPPPEPVLKFIDAAPLVES
jgi:hypothetical protein